MKLNGVLIEDTFAEAFAMWGARAVITGGTQGWAREAATQMSGFATSVIGCKCEAGIERDLPAFSGLIFGWRGLRFCCCWFVGRSVI